MGARKYRHFSIEERCEIARRRQAGESIRQVAAALDRSPSSVARELERNSASTAYKPGYAGEQANARRWRGSRLLRQPELQELVLKLLKRGLSPEAIAGRLAFEHGKKLISHESIYRFIYAQIARTKNYAWRRYLPRAKTKRGYRGRKGGSSALHIAGRVPIAQRPAQFSDRANAGHWEADSMQFSDYRTLLVLARAVVSPHLATASADQAGGRRGQSHSVFAGAFTQEPPTKHHLRQRHRVRRAPRPKQLFRHPDLLLRSPQALAEGWCGERHWSFTSLAAAQDQPDWRLIQAAAAARCPLQSHPEKVPRLADHSRGALKTVALQM